jgi:hypothetical protein
MICNRMIQTGIGSCGLMYRGTPFASAVVLQLVCLNNSFTIQRLKLALFNRSNRVGVSNALT